MGRGEGDLPGADALVLADQVHARCLGPPGGLLAGLFVTR